MPSRRWPRPCCWSRHRSLPWVYSVSSSAWAKVFEGRRAMPGSPRCLTPPDAACRLAFTRRWTKRVPCWARCWPTACCAGQGSPLRATKRCSGLLSCRHCSAWACWHRLRTPLARHKRRRAWCTTGNRSARISSALCCRPASSRWAITAWDFCWSKRMPSDWARPTLCCSTPGSTSAVWSARQWWVGLPTASAGAASYCSATRSTA